jgi:hypothetical protein
VAAIRCRESLVLSSYEEVAILAGTLEEPPLDSGVRFDSAIMQYVSDAHAARGECPGDQQTAMAVKRIAFRTHQAQSPLPGVCKQVIETGPEARPLRHGLVIDEAIAIERRIAWPTA